MFEGVLTCKQAAAVEADVSPVGVDVDFLFLISQTFAMTRDVGTNMNHSDSCFLPWSQEAERKDLTDGRPGQGGALP